MSETECRRCGRPARDAAYYCEECGNALSVALGEIPWLDEELEVTISGQRGRATTGTPHEALRSPLPSIGAPVRLAPT